MRRLFLMTLLFAPVVLSGCQNAILLPGTVENHEAANFSDELTIYTVEFYSRVAVPHVEIAVEQQGQTITRATSSADGIAKFAQLTENEKYEAVVYHANGQEQSRTAFTFDKSRPNLFIETIYPNSQAGLAVPIVLQNPELPNGCEITSLTAMLNYFGIATDKMTMKRDYLPRQVTEIRNNVRYGPDPELAYAGNPASATDGFYVFANPIAQAANTILAEQASALRATNITGASQKEIVNLVKQGYPVLTWVTIDWQTPRTNRFWIVEETGEQHPIYSNLHAVVLTGASKSNVTIMNPLSGDEVIDINTFFSSYEALGAHAVVIQ
ncbi:C39 family peptidase [Metasolibacillus meyeri]|uniref:C39 family peptidase n=1 Tax=Metasolibacillus meyeri TaxID=1071052 RepID=A0AAW9NLJ2_9BACL|nr:C39 family peptidase [Metasolibacillus meyeri]MEC1177321.1 C39 family peptidase [Metasolibacillus meyeri]